MAEAIRVLNAGENLTAEQESIVERQLEGLLSVKKLSLVSTDNTSLECRCNNCEHTYMTTYNVSTDFAEAPRCKIR